MVCCLWVLVFAYCVCCLERWFDMFNCVGLFINVICVGLLLCSLTCVCWWLILFGFIA